MKSMFVITEVKPLEIKNHMIIGLGPQRTYLCLHWELQNILFEYIPDSADPLYM